MERFLAAIERYTTTTGSGEGIAVRGRLITIDSVSLKPRDGAESSVEASVKATAYMLPKDEGLTNGATPAGPAGAATGTTPAGGTPPTGQPSSTPTTTASIRGVK